MTRRPSDCENEVSPGNTADIAPTEDQHLFTACTRSDSTPLQR